MKHPLVFRLLLGLAILTMASSGCRRPVTAATVDLGALAQEIRERFPTVPVISTGELAIWLEADADNRPVLLDVRTPEEFAVSHLPAALNASSPEQALATLADLPEERAVVLYCSVGYRSAALALKLQERGVTNVLNLEGSIFQWANEGRPLRRGAAPVEVVHPFDAEWGRFLARERWSFEP